MGDEIIPGGLYEDLPAAARSIIDKKALDEAASLAPKAVRVAKWGWVVFRDLRAKRQERRDAERARARLAMEAAAWPGSRAVRVDGLATWTPKDLVEVRRGRVFATWFHVRTTNASPFEVRLAALVVKWRLVAPGGPAAEGEWNLRDEPRFNPQGAIGPGDATTMQVKLGGQFDGDVAPFEPKSPGAARLDLRGHGLVRGAWRVEETTFEMHEQALWLPCHTVRGDDG